MALNSLIVLFGLWCAVDTKHCPEQRSLVVNDLTWYEAKTYCESRGLSLSMVEPGAGAGGLLADQMGVKSSSRQWHGGPIFMGPGCTMQANYTCRPLNCTMLTRDTLVNVSCSDKAQAACILLETTENPAEPYDFRLVRTPRSWREAREYCKRFNMTLVVIPDDEKQRQLVEYLLLEETKREKSLFGDYYIGLTKQRADQPSKRWVDGSDVTWSNFVERPSTGEYGVLRFSKMVKWDWNDGIEKLNPICEKIPPPSIRFGLASRNIDGPGADQNNCGATRSSYTIFFHQSGQLVFLVDDTVVKSMYDDTKLGMKYEFRIWMLQSSTNTHAHSFQVRITTSGYTVSCSTPQTLVYTAAKPTHEGCCGKQVQCKHIADVEERIGGYIKSCIYNCQCVDVRCQCSHLVIRFYYVPWAASSQLGGDLYHLMGI